jgi:hypothetical protein
MSFKPSFFPFPFFTKKTKTPPQIISETQSHYYEDLLVYIKSISINGYNDCEASISVDIIKGVKLDQYSERIYCSVEQAKILIDYIEKEVWIQSELVADYENTKFQRKFIKIIEK